MRETTIELRNEIAELEQLHWALQNFAKEHQIDAKVLFQLNLVCDELITNTISYGFPDAMPHLIAVGFACENGLIRITITDDGIAFNPLERQTPDITLDMEQRGIGGLGIHFVRKMMDEVHYERAEGKNRLFLSKKIMGESGEE